MTPPRDLREPLEEILLYPDEDGIPLESDQHREGMTDLIAAVRLWFRRAGRAVYASGNLFIYFVEGQPKKNVGTDVFVIRDHPDHLRRVYKLWEEKRTPELVVELTSPSSTDHDLIHKRALYEDLGVLEYLVFDPACVGWNPPLVAFRRRDGRLVQEEVLRDDGAVAFASDVLGLELRPRGEFLRLWDPRTQDWIPVPTERADDAERRADDAERRADNEQRRAEDERRHAEDADRLAEAERRRAEDAERLAETERRRAEDAERLAETLRRRADELQRRLDALERGMDGTGPPSLPN